MYPQTIQKRVEKQKEHANKNLASWFMKKFSKKTQYIRDQDEESAQADRMRRHGHSNLPSNNSATHAKPRHISAVTNHQNNSNSELNRPKPQRQRSFLRAQLLEMKRESAETLLSAQQKRMAGEIVDDGAVRFGTQLGLDNSDDDDYALDESEDDDLDSVRSVNVSDEIDDALREMTPAEFRAIRKEKWQLKQSRLLEAAEAEAEAAVAAAATGTGSTRSDRAHSSSSNRSRRSSSGANSNKENDGSAVELNRRISRATQMYAEALSQIDHALHPDDHPPEPQPLFLGATKKGSHRPKSEWI